MYKAHFSNKTTNFNTVAGTFSLSGNIQNKINAEVVANEPVLLNIHATLRKPLDNGPMMIKGSWNKITWAINKSDYIHSNKGEIDIHGHPKNYSASINTDFSTSRIPHTTIALDGTGDLHSFNFSKLTGKVLDGSITANGKLSWDPYLSWHIDINGQQINPGILSPKLNVRLNFSAKSDGTLKDNNINANIDIKKLSGTYNGKKLSASSTLSVSNDSLNIHSFHFQLGKNTISANGKIGKSNSINWQVNIKSLKQIHSDFTGTLVSKGFLRGSLKSPLIGGNIEARNI